MTDDKDRKATDSQMPRGRGRRRTVSQSGPPRIPPRGSGRRRASSAASRSREVPLRRSARLLGQSRMTRENASIAEAVARSSLSDDHADLSSRAAGAELGRQRQRERSRRGRGIEDRYSEDEGAPQQQTNGGPPSDMAQNSLLGREHHGERSGNREQIYEMEIAVQPPANARPGRPLYPPITVRLRIRDPHTSEEIDGREELGRLWALASAVEEESQAGPRQTGIHVLTGNLVDSAHPLYDDGDSPGVDQESSATPVEPYPPNTLGSYLTFPGLVLNEVGNFRIRITLIRMESGGTSIVATQEGGVTLGEVRSRIVHIGDDSDNIEMSESLGYVIRSVAEFVLGNDEQAFFESLRRRGIVVPSPPPSPS